MKLRIKGNSIRLRLTQPEVERLADGSRIEACVDFGPGKRKFFYAVETSAEAAEVDGSYERDRMVVLLPSRVAATWANSDLVSIESRGEQGLKILVEKDFACLTVRPDEDESEMFPNPNAASVASTQS